MTPQNVYTCPGFYEHFVDCLMTSSDFSYALARLGWAQASFAEYAGYTPKTVSWWTTGKSAVPVLVAKHLDLLLAIRDHLPG
jgi:hypothetical protein